MPELYKRPRSNKWQCECYYIDAAGERQRVQRSTGVVDDGSAQSRRTAEIAARDLERALANGLGRQAKPTTLRSAYADLIDERELAGRAPRTLKLIEQTAVHVMRYFGEARDLRAQPVTDAELRAYAMHARKKRSAGTVNQEILRLRAAHRLAVGTTPKAPPLGVVYTPTERVLTPAEFQRVLLYVPQKWHDHALVYRLLGLSESELYKIGPEDVFPDRETLGVVHVRGTKRRTRDRWLPMPPQVREILLRRLAEGRLPFEKWRSWRALSRAARRAGIGFSMGTNVTRASFGTELAAADVGNVKIAKAMGHSSTKMVDTVYVRTRALELQDAIGRLSSYEPVESVGRKWGPTRKPRSVTAVRRKGATSDAPEKQ